MSSVCISDCVNDTRVPVRARYINRYKWPESNAEFFKTVKMDKSYQGWRYPHHSQATVVDSVSCRQMYLRSYTFSREESICLRRLRSVWGKLERKVGVSIRTSNRLTKGSGRGKKRCAKEFSCASLCNIFWRLLTCTTTTDAVAK